MFDLYYGRLKKGVVGLFISCLCLICIMVGLRKRCLAFHFMSVFDLNCGKLKEQIVILFISCLYSICIMLGQRKGWLAFSIHIYV